MARYPIFDGVPEGVDVIIGFERNYPGFFVMIEDKTNPRGPETYYFNNITDHPGVVMTITQIEETLSRFQIPITREDIERLVKDAERNRFEENVLGAMRMIPGTNQAELDDFRAVKERYGLTQPVA